MRTEGRLFGDSFRAANHGAGRQFFGIGGSLAPRRNQSKFSQDDLRGPLTIQNDRRRIALPGFYAVASRAASCSRLTSQSGFP